MEHSDIGNKWSTFHTFTIYWSLWETVTGWAPADLYFVPMPACTALPLNANFGLSDWSYWSSGLIYISDLSLVSFSRYSPLLVGYCKFSHHMWIQCHLLHYCYSLVSWLVADTWPRAIRCCMLQWHTHINRVISTMLSMRTRVLPMVRIGTQLKEVWLWHDSVHIGFIAWRRVHLVCLCNVVV